MDTMDLAREYAKHGTMSKCEVVAELDNHCMTKWEALEFFGTLEGIHHDAFFAWLGY